MKTKLIGLLMASAALCAFAQDKAVLEALVKKGLITQQEAAQIAKESVAVTPGGKDTKSIKIKGGISAWYGWSQADNKTFPGGSFGEQPQKNGFDLRYVKIGVEADLGAGWSAEVVTDFGMSGKQRDYLDKVIISKQVKLDYLAGTLDIGMKTTPFGQEQMMDDFGQLAIERSVATHFFAAPNANPNDLDNRRNIGGRAVGIFWNGTVAQAPKLYYGVAIVGGNSFEDGWDRGNEEGNNNLTYYANMGYRNTWNYNDEAISLDAGVNYVYANGGYVWHNGAAWENRSIWGVNPYVSAKWRGLTLMGEFFFQRIENGKSGANPLQDGADPLGVNVTVAYKFDIGEWGALEPVLRYSWLESNGAGIYGSGVNGDNLSVNNIPYNNAKQVYLGVNWYACDSVKFSAGYEWAQYTDVANPGNFGGQAGDAYRTNSSTVRAQLQVVF